ncbi:MAG TPA: HAD-IA family hydrolase [Candidatus Saccharimonadales bacterium]
MDERDLGARLQAARQKAGLTQQALCQRADLSYSTLTKIERGAIKSPSIFTIQRIAEAVGTNLDELLGSLKAKTPAAKPKKRAKSGVRFVYFDINGCLVRFFHGAFTRIAADTGASVDFVEQTFWHFNDQACRGELTLEEFDHKLAKAFGVEDVDWMTYYLEAVEPIPAVGELVRWAAEHYRVGLLSNILPGIIDALRARELLPDVAYDVIIDSSQLGVIKPEAKIYEIATQEAHCSASDILFIDDSRANLMAAEKMGWHVLWFDDYRPDESVDRVRAALEFEG